MWKIHKKVKVVVEQNAPSLKKKVSATNFYETIKTTLSKSSLSACFFIALPMECWNKSLSIKDIYGYKTKYVKWKGMVYMNIYAHLKDFNIAILENTWRKAATVSSLLNICNYTENGSAQSYLRKMLLIGLSLLFSKCRCAEPWGTSFLDNLSAGCLDYESLWTVSVNFAMKYIWKEVKILRLFKFRHRWFPARVQRLMDWT